MSVLRLDPGAVQWREVQGEVIAVDLRNSRYLSVNRSGALLWPLLWRGTTITELARVLMDRWSLDEPVAHRDADRLVGWLHDAGLLVTEGN
jgi:hypothetical protein